MNKKLYEIPHGGFLPQTWNVIFPAVRIESAYSLQFSFRLSVAGKRNSILYDGGFH